MRLGWVAVPLVVGVCLLACGGGGDGAAAGADAGILDSSVQNDGGPTEAVTIRTTAPAGAQSPPRPGNAKLALRLEDDGKTWSELPPSGAGVYTMQTGLARWVAAFVCADDTNDATVAIYERAAAVTSLDVVLGPPCAANDGKVWDLSGTFSNLPATTSWFDFAYSSDARGSVLPLTGTSAAYELPHLVEGTWDLVFGFRDDSGSPLTKLFVRRAQAVAANFTIDADIGATGITPVMHAVSVAGAANGESLALPILYSVGGVFGVDVGPENLTTASGQYATVPAAAEQPGDLYRFALAADVESDAGATSRGANGTFHTGGDLTLTLPPALPVPTVTTVATTPYLRVAVKTVGHTGAATYELDADTRVTDQVHRVWTYSTDAAVADGAELDITLPDFSAVPTFSAQWALTTDGDTTVGAKAIEAPVPVLDGTAARFASASVQLPPP